MLQWENVNEEQKEAVRYVNGPLLVVAGAGTGKTSVLVEKIKYLIKKRLSKPEQILTLTFTEKAAREMEERVDKALPYGYFQMWISTFHSFADKILREEAHHIGLPTGFRLLTEAEAIMFLRNNLFLFNLKYFRPLGNPNKFLGALFSHFSRLKDEDISEKEYLKWATLPKKTMGLDEVRKNTELAYAYKLYQSLKIREGYLDFSDLIYYLVLLFKKRLHLVRKYQVQFPYVLVDEFQDTNIVQYQLIKLLCPPKDNPRLTVVGDDSQAIYKFRGASVSNIIGFMKDYPKAKQVTLRKNYRSVQPILNTAYRLIKHNDPDTLESQLGISKNLVARRKPGNEQVEKAVNFFFAENVLEEAEYVASEIIKLKDSNSSKDSYSFSDFAILLRANSYAEPFIRALSYRGIPYQFWGPGILYKQPEIKDLIAYLTILSNVEDSLSLYRVLSMDIFDIDQKDISLLLSFTKRCNLSLFQALGAFLSFSDKTLYQEDFAIYKPYLPKLQKKTQEKLRRLYSMIKRHLALLKRETAGQILYYFLEDSSYLAHLVKYKTPKEEKQALNISKFFLRLKSYEQEHEDASIFTVVDYIKMSMELGESPLVSEPETHLYDAVNLLTVHAAKGLEFRVVFLINLTSGRFPPFERKEKIPIPEELIKEILPQGDYHILEERRLFYVAVTRAMDHLYLTSSQFYGEGKRERKLSPFVVEALGDDLIRLKTGEKKDRKAQLSIFDYKMTPEKVIKKIILPTYFSFSQLNTFLTCPLQYKLRYLLKIPEPPSATASFGSTMHITLEAFYRQFLKNRGVGENNLLKLFHSSWIPLGYSSAAHEKRMKKEGEKMLKNYFSKLHDSHTTIIDLEKFFTIKIGDISIVGKIDRVDKKKAGQIEIIDYKTGRKVNDKELQQNLQLSIYLLAAIDKNLYDKKPEEVTLTFYFLQGPDAVSIKKPEEAVPKVQETIKNIVDKIRSFDFSRDTIVGCNTCSYCLIFSDKEV